MNGSGCQRSTVRDSYEYGTEVVGGILSLRDLRAELLALSDELGELADQYRGTGKPAPPEHPANR